MLFLRMLQYILLLPIDFGFGMFCRIFVNWWAPIFCDENGNLPNWLSWVGTFDATLDSGWKDGYDGFNPSDPKFKNRVKWLYRNTSYGFSYWVTGIKFDPKDWTIHKSVDTPTKTLFIATSSQGYFNITYHGKWGEYKLGWKAWNYWLSDQNKWKDAPWGPEWRTQYVCSPNPFKRI